MQVVNLLLKAVHPPQCRAALLHAHMCISLLVIQGLGGLAYRFQPNVASDVMLVLHRTVGCG